MRATSSLVALAVAAGLASAAPVRRAANASDILVLKFADVLNQLESNFYQQALSKFQESDFQTAGFSSPQMAIQQLQVIQSDEESHISALEGAIQDLGSTPITGCQFDFSSVLTDVTTVTAVSRVVENVGVSAFLGAATLIVDPLVLEAAGSILTIEARHQTIMNVLSGTGIAIPQAFDIGLTPSEILAIAGPFISGCDLGVPANPTLTISNTAAINPGTSLSFQSSALNGSTDGLFCNMLVGGASFSISLPFSQCVVPQTGVSGPVAVWITSDDQPLAGNVRDRATTQLIAGPAMTFVDTTPQIVVQNVRSVSGASSSSSSSSGSSSSGSSSSGSSASNNMAATCAGADASLANMATGPSQNGQVTVDGWQC